jgi:hypothetical protein
MAPGRWCGRRERHAGSGTGGGEIKGLIMTCIGRGSWLLSAAVLVALAGAGAARAQQTATATGATSAAAPTPAALSAEPSGPVDLIAAPFPQPRPPSTTVRVAILDASPSLQRAGRIAVLLTHFRKKELEEHIGMKIELANISSIPEQPAMGSVVFYRPAFLRAAALLAKAIPGEQAVRVMPPERLATSGVDVEILLGGKDE